ncbi:hypothetical protein EX30DRAFT_372357 [Ascodesmis nigricans]|uniref:Uncharacterized protein n=1 Tax=Ascodesmis nigricans TaxID=341454 RepID=A0A4S2MV31_9PEZI|nr:hypothetical protein EX30DRAFT_372357 [Ascodesmis nigricans]
MTEPLHSGSRRHSRRSTGGSINFAQMSISPLTTTDLTEHHFTKNKSKSSSSQRSKTPTHNRSYHTRSSSYLQGLSAPSTPGILSSSSTFSFTPLHTSATDGSPLTKSKSSTHLRKSTSRSSIADEWLHRTGAALSADARESKGQSWLTTRDSSTSLKLSDDSDDEHGAMAGSHHHGDDDDAASQYYAASEHAHGAMTPMWAHTDDEGDLSAVGKRRSREIPGSRASRSRSRPRSLPGELGGGIVHQDEDATEDEDEEEDEMYTRRHTFVIGQFIDRWIGWSIFGAEDETEDETAAEEEDMKRKRRQMAVHREPPDEEQLREMRRRRDQTEDWQDPAWILSVASNLLF